MRFALPCALTRATPALAGLLSSIEGLTEAHRSEPLEGDANS